MILPTSRATGAWKIYAECRKWAQQPSIVLPKPLAGKVGSATWGGKMLPPTPPTCSFQSPPPPPFPAVFVPTFHMVCGVLQSDGVIPTPLSSSGSCGVLRYFPSSCWNFLLTANAGVRIGESGTLSMGWIGKRSAIYILALIGEGCASHMFKHLGDVTR
jgi:hypothetical protein